MSDASVSNLLGMARTAALAGNNEEALGYFNRVLEVDPTVSEAWMGKGKAAGWQSTLVNFRLNEAIVAFGHAIGSAPEREKMAITSQAVAEINGIVVAIYQMSRNHMSEFISLDNTWVSYISQVTQLLDGLDRAHAFDPSDRVTLENTVHLTKDLIEGVSYQDPYDYNTPKTWHLSEEYEVVIKSREQAAVDALKAIDPSYVAPAVQKKNLKSDGCFVVTATMGDFNHPTVTILRSFRDEWLSKRFWGRYLTRAYYRVGPGLARYVGQNRRRREISFRLFVSPAAWIAGRLLR